MSLKRKLEGEVEIRAAAADVHHDIYKSTPHHVSHAAPHFVQSCDLHEGELGEVGSVVNWKVTLDGKPVTVKGKILEIDEDKKLISYTCIEGDLLDVYKSITAISQVIPKDSETSIIKWVIDYEKKHPGVPEPTHLLDALLGAATDIDDHHHRNK
ncbi:hypothetical protein KSS87_006988 [Heliosperma pusillum]|nr:hypothetical protein KSS87_006988 [Heliosperma pusillum]